MPNSSNEPPIAASSKPSPNAIAERPRRPPAKLQSAQQFVPGIDTDVETDAPLRVMWECVRSALDVGIPPSRMLPIPNTAWGDYGSLLEHLARKALEETAPLPHPVNLDAWEKLITSPETISLKGSLILGFHGKEVHPTLRLNSVVENRDRTSFRLGQAFGGDRFLTINVSFQEKISFAQKDELRGWLQRWLLGEKTFLGRTWRAFLIREKKKPPSSYEIKFFGTSDGGPSGPACITSPSASLEHIIRWLIPLSHEGNRAMLASKLYSRLELGFSKTYQTVTFHPHQIHEVDDQYGDDAEEDSQFNDPSFCWSPFLNLVHTSSQVMSDGCGRISVGAANAIWKCFGTSEPVPSAFQGRIANAKGLWVKSIDSERDTQDPVWIETTASQRKFHRHEEDRDEDRYDKHRTTFDLLAWSSQLAPSHLSISLLSILQDRGVPKSSIAQLVRTQMNLEKDLFLDALDNPTSLPKWISEKLPGAPPDDDPHPFQASMPKLRSERIARLVRAGFEPRTCHYLSSLIRKGLEDWLKRLGNKLEIRITHSTFAFGVADFQHVLQPGEVFLSFSRILPDAQLPCLHGRDVLVARYPMHRPSDVQKVRAVYCPELASIQDVVVFSACGGFPLAGKLSNGDYDGDRYWICWEPLLVQDFKNAPPPVPPNAKSLGIHVEPRLVSDFGELDDLLTMAFDFHLSEKMLGLCANYQERYGYEMSNLRAPKMARLSDLRDCLVDASKNGYRFNFEDWWSFLNRGHYPRKLSEPAYKQSIDKATRYKEENIVDYVKFAVIKDSLGGFKAEAEMRLPHTHIDDEHLSGPYTARYHEACNGEDDQVRGELECLVENLLMLVSDWKVSRNASGGGIKGYEDDIERAYIKYRQITPRNTGHRVVSGWTDRSVKNGLTTWDILKASALYANIVDHRMSHFVFSLAGREFLFMKALSVDPDAQFVTSSVMATLRIRKRRETEKKL